MQVLACKPKLLNCHPYCIHITVFTVGFRKDLMCTNTNTVSNHLVFHYRSHTLRTDRHHMFCPDFTQNNKNCSLCSPNST